MCVRETPTNGRLYFISVALACYPFLSNLSHHPAYVEARDLDICSPITFNSIAIGFVRARLGMRNLLGGKDTDTQVRVTCFVSPREGVGSYSASSESPRQLICTCTQFIYPVYAHSAMKSLSCLLCTTYWTACKHSLQKSNQVPQPIFTLPFFINSISYHPIKS